MKKVEELVDTINEHFNRTLTTVYCKDIKDYNLDPLYISYLFHKLRSLGYIVSIRDNLLSVMLTSSEDYDDGLVVPGFVELHTVSNKSNSRFEPGNYQEKILISISSIRSIKSYKDNNGNNTTIETDSDYCNVVETLSEIKSLLINSSKMDNVKPVVFNIGNEK